MAKIKLNGDTSGYIEISAPAVSGNNTLELGPGTKILTNLDNTFTGIATFSNGLDVTGGNFLVGTTSAGGWLAKIQVADNASYQSAFNITNNVNADLQVEIKSSETRFGPSTNTPLVFKNGGGERLRITSDGNMGVGNADPTQARLVAQTASGVCIAAVKDNTGASISLGGVTQPRILMEAGASVSELKILTAGGSSYGSASWTERLRVHSHGQLELKVPDANPALKITPSGTNAPAAIDFNTPGTGVAKLLVQGTERLRIASDGVITVTGRAGAAASTAIDPLSSFVLNDGEARLQLCATNGGSNAAGVILSNESKHFIIHQRGPQVSNHFDIGYLDDSSPTDINNQASPYFRITTGGAVTLPQQPRFFAWGNSSINMSTTGYHTWATFTNTRFNVGNDFSTSTKIFTAPVDGTYAFGCNCRLDQGGTGYFRLILSINGSTADNDQAHSIRNSDAANASFHSQEITALYQLSANDNVRVIVEANSDSSWQMQSESQFWGYLVA